MRIYRHSRAPGCCPCPLPPLNRVRVPRSCHTMVARVPTFHGQQMPGCCHPAATLPCALQRSASRLSRACPAPAARLTAHKSGCRPVTALTQRSAVQHSDPSLSRACPAPAARLTAAAAAQSPLLHSAAQRSAAQCSAPSLMRACPAAAAQLRGPPVLRCPPAPPPRPMQSCAARGA